MDILVVEDDTISARALSRLLKFKGHAIEVAATCREALAAAEIFRFDLAILDLTLPDGDGCDLLARLLTRRPVSQPARSAIQLPLDTEDTNKGAGSIVVSSFQLDWFHLYRV